MGIVVFMGTENSTHCCFICNGAATFYGINLIVLNYKPLVFMRHFVWPKAMKVVETVVSK